LTTASPDLSPRKPLGLSLRQADWRGILWQILVVAIAVAIVSWLWSNTVHNLSLCRIATGFAFPGREAGMPIAGNWLAFAMLRFSRRLETQAAPGE
jgi:general L-amino acid transport system permease protein